MNNKKTFSILILGFFIIASAGLISYFINYISRLDLDIEHLNSNLSQVLSLESDEALVTRVVDGDTIVIDTDKRVRYIGIDTPEKPHSKSAECFALNSHLKNSSLVMGKKVRLEKDISEIDRYGRLLRYVYVDDVFVNYELVAQGYAVAKEYPPDTKYAQLFREAELEAKKKKLGIWKYCFEEDGEYTDPLEEILDIFSQMIPTSILQ